MSEIFFLIREMSKTTTFKDYSYNLLSKSHLINESGNKTIVIKTRVELNHFMSLQIIFTPFIHINTHTYIYIM